MNKPSDFNDLRASDRILACIEQAQPVSSCAAPPAESNSSEPLPLDSDTANTPEEAASHPDAVSGRIRVLAELGAVEYDQVRKQEAKMLGIRSSTLDAQVFEARATMAPVENATAGIPWPPPGESFIVDETGAEVDAPASDTDGIPFGFVVNQHGVFCRADRTRRKGQPEMIRICSELRVTALARDPASQNWGRVLEFHDADGVPHQWVMPMAMLAGDGVDLRKELVQQGLEIAPGHETRNRLAGYITTCKPQARGRSVQKTGWFDSVFVLPDRTLGVSQERILFQSEKAARPYEQAGTLSQWQDNIARLCCGNSRLTLAVSAAFAGPMLLLAGHDSGGIHFVGPSSIGKTTVLAGAASVYGGSGYVQTWRATSNGLEGLCAMHNDTLLILDELAQVDPKEAGSVAYMIGNGSGKTRSDRHGDARDKKTWRLLFLSSGEVGLAQHMSEAGKAAKAGQEVRMIDIAADAGAGYGIFENLHGFENGTALSDAIRGAAKTYYGTAAMAFIESMTTELKELPALLRDAIAKFMETYLPAGAGGQAARVCARFAVIACAGEYATDKGITGWAPGEAIKAAATCFNAWLDQRGGAGNQEKAAILAAVRAFFETHGDARFTEVRNGHDRPTINRAGFRDYVGSGQEYYVLPQVYGREVCEGFDQRTVSKVLLEAGWLRPDKHGKSSQKKSLPDLGETRCYVFTPAMWGDGDVG